MQTVAQVVCTRGTSVRDSVAKDSKLSKFDLETSVLKKQGRRPGWTKIRSTLADRKGSLNMQWNRATNILTCRVVTRGLGRPNLIVGDFIDYLMARQHKRIRVITVFPV